MMKQLMPDFLCFLHHIHLFAGGSQQPKHILKSGCDHWQFSFSIHADSVFGTILTNDLGLQLI